MALRRARIKPMVNLSKVKTNLVESETHNVKLSAKTFTQITAASPSGLVVPNLHATTVVAPVSTDSCNDINPLIALSDNKGIIKGVSIDKVIESEEKVKETVELERNDGGNPTIGIELIPEEAVQASVPEAEILDVRTIIPLPLEKFDYTEPPVAVVEIEVVNKGTIMRVSEIDTDETAEKGENIYDKGPFIINTISKELDETDIDKPHPQSVLQVTNDATELRNNISQKQPPAESGTIGIASNETIQTSPSIETIVITGGDRQRHLTGKQDKENRVIQAKKEFKKKLSNGVVERSKMTMFDLIYYNPPVLKLNVKKDVLSNDVFYSNSHAEEVIEAVSRGMRDETNDTSNFIIQQRLEEESVDDVTPFAAGTSSRPTSPTWHKVMEAETTNNEEIEEEEEEENNREEKDDEPGVPAPRVKVGPDGQIVLDEQSLMIETTDCKRAREGTYTVTEAPSAKRKRSCDWTINETIKFYKALNAVGTDFSLMSMLFKNRSRYELKGKFKKEERLNPVLIDSALSNSRQFDLGILQMEFAKEEAEEEAIKQELLKKEFDKKRGKDKMADGITGYTVGRAASNTISYNSAVRMKSKDPSKVDRRRKKAQTQPTEIEIYTSGIDVEVDAIDPLSLDTEFPSYFTSNDPLSLNSPPKKRKQRKKTTPLLRQALESCMKNTLIEPPLYTDLELPADVIPAIPPLQPSSADAVESYTPATSALLPLTPLGSETMHVICNNQSLNTTAIQGRNSMTMNIDPSHINGNPGDVIVLTSPAPGNPEQNIYQFFVVSPRPYISDS